jgi:hypothetical protein
MADLLDQSVVEGYACWFGNARQHRINETCVGCFPSAAGVVTGRPAPTATGGCA